MGNAPHFFDRRAADPWRQHHMQTAVGQRMQVGKLGAEQEAFLRPPAFFVGKEKSKRAVGGGVTPSSGGAPHHGPAAPWPGSPDRVARDCGQTSSRRPSVMFEST